MIPTNAAMTKQTRTVLAATAIRPPPNVTSATRRTTWSRCRTSAYGMDTMALNAKTTRRPSQASWSTTRATGEGRGAASPAPPRGGRPGLGAPPGRSRMFGGTRTRKISVRMMSTKNKAMPVMTTGLRHRFADAGRAALRRHPLVGGDHRGDQAEDGGLERRLDQVGRLGERGEAVQEARRPSRARPSGRRSTAGDDRERDDAVEQHRHDDRGQHPGGHQPVRAG